MLKSISLLLIFTFSLLSTACTKEYIKTTLPPKKINGVSWVGSNNKIDGSHITSVTDVNANYSALIPFAFMYNLTDTKIVFNTNNQWWGESEIGVRTTAQLFKEKGIKRMLKPQIWVLGGKFVGDIEMQSEEDWIALEKNYEEYISFYAKIAEDEGIEIFCLGTELKKFVINRPKYWSKLIQNIRKIYSGKLTYAANWDSYTNATFWSSLDFIGIDAYFPLSQEKNITTEELNKNWQPIFKDIENFSKKYNTNILFTEFGYRNVEYTCREPWTSDESLVKNNKNQITALQSLFDTFWDKEWFSGGFLWKWFDYHKTAGGENNTGFTVQNKPAEKTVRDWFYNYKN